MINTKKIVLFLLLPISILGVASSFLFQRFHLTLNSAESSGVQQQIQSNDSIPILIAGSFLNKRDDIRLDEIKQGFMRKRIFCTPDIAEFCKYKFQLDFVPNSIALNQFDYSNDSLLIITTIDSITPQLLALKVDGVSFFDQSEGYKLWNTSNHTFDFKKDITRYMHTGVTAITRSAGSVIDRKGIDFYLKNIEPFFTKAELIHISNEVSIQQECDYGSMKMKFATRANHFEIIKRLGANIIELTGNHNLDVGSEPYLNSLKWYENNGMSYFGGGRSPSEANRPLVKVLKDGQKVAWIGFNELCPCGECADKGMGANRYRPEKAKKLIDSLHKDGISYIIACVQFGETDSYSPTSTQKAICKYIIDCGADVILGSQAHQAQEIALYKDKIIFYGLGNFMFDQIHRIGVRQAFFLKCYFYKGRIIQYEPVYTFMNAERQPSMASAAEKYEIQRSILKKNNFLKSH
jgi:poly-gamma-glutamate capsule biosynthesis protein CapA/YwtB (metallophosphatase superfamily)